MHTQYWEHAHTNAHCIVSHGLLCPQITSILNDETAVEHVKKDGPKRQPKSKMALCQEIFGRGEKGSAAVLFLGCWMV